MLAGVISMFVDNVVTILMMAPVALPLARAVGVPAAPVILMIGFGANFMGTALIIGDLPPQMLHSVAGAEFFDFIWQFGRPSSFPILMVTFLVTLGAMYAYGFRGMKRVTNLAGLGVDASNLTNLDAIKLLLSLRSNQQRIVFPNTNSGYGATDGTAFCTEETPLEPISLYGRTKCDAERHLLEQVQHLGSGEQFEVTGEREIDLRRQERRREVAVNRRATAIQYSLAGRAA